MRSEDSNWNSEGNSARREGEGVSKPRRNRIGENNFNRSERPDFNSERSFNNERTYNQDRMNNDFNREGRRPSFNQGGDRPRFNQGGDRPRFNQDGDRPRFNQGGDRPRFNQDGDRPRFNQGGDRPRFNQGGDRPRFNQDGDRPRFNQGGDRPRFNQDGDRPRFNQGGDRPRFNQDGDRPRFNQGGDRPRFNQDGDRPRFNQGGDRPRYNQGGGSYGENRPYNRDGNSQGGYQKRSYGNQEGEDRPRFGQGGGQRPNNRFGQGGQRPGGFNSGYSRKKQEEYKDLNLDPNEPIRLNKYLANAGLCSRREADEFIQAGVVTVNGEVVNELGTKVKRGDKVLFHDQSVNIERKVYVLLNKPKDCVTTTDDPQARMTVMQLTRTACKERIYPVGRLDRNTTGVLLLTNDGELASKLTHPKFVKKKIYQVTLDKPVTQAHMEQIADGIELEDGEIHADAISYTNTDMKNSVGIEIHSGRNRIVRRIFEHLGYKVYKLDRVYFAGLTKKGLSRGKYRHLTEKEVNMLRMGAFE